VYSELDNWNTLRAVITPKWKYIYDYKDNAEKLYDITSDPMELNDLAEIETTQLKHLKERLFNWESHAKKYPTTKLSPKLSPEEKEKLKNLGYIQ